MVVTIRFALGLPLCNYLTDVHSTVHTQVYTREDFTLVCY